MKEKTFWLITAVASALVLSLPIMLFLIEVSVFIPTNIRIGVAVVWAFNWLPFLWCMNEIVKAGLADLFGES